MARKSKKRLMDTSKPASDVVEERMNPYKMDADKALKSLNKTMILDVIRNMVTGLLSKEAYVKHVDALFAQEREDVFEELDELIPEYTKRAFGEASVNVDFDGMGKDILDHFKVTRVQGTKVTYDAEKLREILPKSIAKEVISTDYLVVDYPGFVELMSSHGIKPKEFAQYVSPQRYVDAKEVDRLVDTGVLKTEDLMPAITVTTRKRYYRITKRRRKD